MSDTLSEIVIAGAGMAGLHAAEALRERGFEGRLTLVGEEPHRPYSRPPLSKEVLTGIGMDPANGEAGWLVGHRALRLREDSVLDGLDLEFRPNTRAVGLDPAAREVRLAGPEGEDSLRYDGLVIATGARARRPRPTWAGSTCCAPWTTPRRSGPPSTPPGAWWWSARVSSGPRWPRAPAPWAWRSPSSRRHPLR